MADAKQRWTPGIGAFKQWMHENSNSIATDIPLAHNDSLTFSSENVLAHNVLLYVRDKNWNLAYQDAKKVLWALSSILPHSLIHASSLSTFGAQPWGTLPKRSRKLGIMSQRGRFKHSILPSGTVILRRATCCFWLRFAICMRESLSTRLFTSQTIILFEAGKYDEAISRLQDLNAVPSDAETAHCCNQVNL